MTIMEIEIEEAGEDAHPTGESLPTLETLYTRFEKAKKRNKSEMDAVAEHARFVFCFAEKDGDTGGIKIGNMRYSREKLAGYGKLFDYAGINPKKAKDVEKEIYGVMYV